MTPHRFIVPIKGVNTFCTFTNGQLCPENPLPQVGYGEQAIDDEFGWVAWPAEDGKTIGRTHLDATEGEGGFAPLVMPADYKAECLLFHRQVLFVGGDCGKEVLGSFDLASPKPEWLPLEVPDQFRQYGKRIDDLLLDGDRLIAVDDIVSPKYLLRYDVAEPRAPKLMDVREIPYHSSYETIHSGAVGTDWVALYSTSMNHGWRGIHIALLDRASLTERSSLTGTGKGTYRGSENSETARDWRQVAFHGNILLVAAGTDGVGVLNLDTLGAAVPGDWDATHGIWGAPPEAQEFEARCLKALRYQPLPARFVGYAVTRVVPIPGSRHFLAVMDTEPGFDTVVMELP